MVSRIMSIRAGISNLLDFVIDLQLTIDVLEMKLNRIQRDTDNCS